MTTVTVSPKYQVVIPQVIREKFDIKPGEKLQVFYYEGRLELVPLTGQRKKMRGFLKGMDTAIPREDDRL